MNTLFLVTPLLGMTLLAATDRQDLSAPPAGDRVAFEITFGAQVGDQPFACGTRYEGVGLDGATIEGRDLRFYVSDVAVRSDGASWTPLELDPDPRWQFRDVALLDFEDGTGGCRNGNPDLRDRVVGTLPAGALSEGPVDLRFTLGVPFDLNHQNQALAPGPLSLTALFWSWNAGYKFLRAEVLSDGLEQGFFVHLGSTRCTPEGQATRPATSCLDSNRVEVVLPGYNPADHRVVFDLAALLAGTPLGSAASGERGACMSAPGSPLCAGVFQALGLPFEGGEPEAGQRIFRLEEGHRP